MSVRTLVIDTATEACSVALFDDAALVAGQWEMLKRGHAERLIPMIAELPERGRAERIWANCGPGSFTGLRVGLAAARALALAWDAELSGYTTHALVAAMAFDRFSGAADAEIVMTGGHGEWFVQAFGIDGAALDALASLPPAIAIERSSRTLIAGSMADAASEQGMRGDPLLLWPDARQAMLMPPASRNLPPDPVYGRSPDAKPQASIVAGNG